MGHGHDVWWPRPQSAPPRRLQRLAFLDLSAGPSPGPPVASFRGSVSDACTMVHLINHCLYRAGQLTRPLFSAKCLRYFGLAGFAPGCGGPISNDALLVTEHLDIVEFENQRANRRPHLRAFTALIESRRTSQNLRVPIEKFCISCWSLFHRERSLPLALNHLGRRQRACAGGGLLGIRSEAHPRSCACSASNRHRHDGFSGFFVYSGPMILAEPCTLMADGGCSGARVPDGGLGRTTRASMKEVRMGTVAGRCRSITLTRRFAVLRTRG